MNKITFFIITLISVGIIYLINMHFHTILKKTEKQIIKNAIIILRVISILIAMLILGKSISLFS